MEKRLYKILNELHIGYQKIEHDKFPNCEISGSFYKDNNMGLDCKNIFMRDRRGKRHYLIIILSKKTIDIPKLAIELGENKKMGLASEDRLYKFLGLKPGSVTPFALINKSSKDVNVVLDKDILAHKYIHFHPLRNTATLKITTNDFRKFLDKYSQNKLIYLDFE